MRSARLSWSEGAVRAVTIAALSSAAIIAATAPAAAGTAPTGDSQNFEMIEKGRALATAADCVSCHTVPNGGQPYAGGLAIETPFGNVVAPNITPDRETGIGAWTDEQFDAAVRHGRRPDGSLLYPAMPYTSYTKMSRDDVRAIRAYLDTVTPVHNAVVANQLPFPFNIRAAMHVWNMLYFTPGEFKPDPQKSAEWNRGAYLVQALDHCGACHTPKTTLGGDDTSRAFQGAALQGWFAPNITNDKAHGLAAWSVDDIVAYLKTGHNRLSAATGPMADEVAMSSSHMPEADLKAIAVYLKDLPGAGAAKAATPLAASDPQMVAGAAIYHDSCSACHGADGKGVPKMFPALAGSTSVTSPDATTLVRVLLRGARSVATAAEPTAPAMPSYSQHLSDDQIAAVLTYIRNSWGTAAPAVTPKAVQQAREALAQRTD